jgi:predicted ATPase/class 3 adenylate cyclase/Tfp pilus assembly protein PilF
MGVSRTRVDSILPTGTVTFLFTDVEGSTPLWEERTHEMRPALEHHDRMLRAAVESSGGHVIKTLGDGMVAVFADAKSALAASLAAQRALQANGDGSASIHSASGARLPIVLKVRMGLHTGVADLREGDYFGTPVNRAARIMAVAHGEQILLSAATAELVRGDLVGGVTLRDMGEHRLKGLVNPERLLQVVAPGLRTEFPPLASQTGHSLPAERDAFVGRSETLADLERRFAAGARLVSILGIGGSGKTRLATRFGWSTLRTFSGGVWFCDLTPARGPDGILHAVAQGLDVALGKDDPVAQLGRAIEARGQCLIILDNFEQVARHVEETLGRWLSRAPKARFLVTTREVLGLPGEEILALPQLGPDEAIDLFTRRAKAAKPGFDPSAEDTAAIAPLMRLLDGLPLAVELAAARVRVMPPRTLLARMSERFKLLSSAGGRIDRQATLRAVFDWSWDLLSLPEKGSLAQLSVFEGGFALDAVEAVVDLTSYDGAPWPVDVLQSLVQKSLVRHAPHDRFDLLVSVQEYATEHLRSDRSYEGSGAAARLAAEARHGTYFANLDDRTATANACADLDNLVVACRRAAARGDAEVAAKALERAWSGLKLRGPFRAGVELASAVASTARLGPAAAARVNWVAGSVLEACGKDSEARMRLEASLVAARAVGDRDCECKALVDLGVCLREAGNLETSRLSLEAAQTIASALNDPGLQCIVRNNLGTHEVATGRLAEACVHYEKALLLAREAADRRLQGAVLANLGMLHDHMGMRERARAHHETSLVAAQEVGDRKLEANTLCNLGLSYFLEGRLTDARDHLEAAVAVARDMGHAYGECVALCNLGIVQESLNDLNDAESHLERALALAREMEHRRSEGQVLGYLGRVHARRAEFGDARHCLDTAEALLRAMSDPESLGIVLAIRAETEHLAGVGEAARGALSAAEAIAAEVSTGADSEFGHALARARSSLGR